MECGHALDVSNAASGEFRSFRDAHTRLQQTYDASMVREIRLAASVPPCPLRDFDALALPLADQGGWVRESSSESRLKIVFDDASRA